MASPLHRRKTAAAAACLILALAASGAVARTGGSLPERLARGPVLWVGAHPDDELFVSPLLGEVCVRRGAPCTLLVLTRGEAGECRLPGGCRPSLAAVRTREIGRAAALLGARLRLWTLPDGSAASPAGVLDRWDAEYGRRELSRRLAAVLAEVRPKAVITFDPRHGSTCHSDHRAAGELIRRQLAAMAGAPDLYDVETLLSGNVATGDLHFLAAGAGDPHRLSFDARASWAFVLGVAAAHRSQFDEPRRTGLARMPAAERKVTLLPIPGAQTPADGRYEHRCGD